jgi:hypothetical protein
MRQLVDFMSVYGMRFGQLCLFEVVGGRDR